MYKNTREMMYMPHIPSIPVDIYTVRIFDASTRPSLLQRLRKAVVSGGGTCLIELVESRGFMFSVPLNTPNPLTSYVQARWLEEGCLHVSKMASEERRERWGGYTRRSVQSEEMDPSDGDEVVEVETYDHPNLHMRWTWSELQR